MKNVKPHLLSILAAAFIPLGAHAQDMMTNIFIEALEKGKASAPLKGEPWMENLIQAYQTATGSSEPLYVDVTRKIKFRDQPQCGRIAFKVLQKGVAPPAGGMSGGDLNICADGSPPLAACKGDTKLVPESSTCPDGTKPTQTAEIQAAIRASIDAGNISHEEARKRVAKTHEQLMKSTK